jgi:lysophospholipase L1-like esterase
VETTDRVFLLGDSEAFLLGYELPQKARAEGIAFSSWPVAGSSVISWARENDKGWAAMRQFKPTVVLVSLGANDACMGTRIIANERPYLATVTRRLSRARVRVVWLGPPRIGAPAGCGKRDCLERAIPGLEAFAKMVSAEHTYLDGRQVQVSMWDDLLHPDGAGRAAWATWIWKELRK